MNLALPSDYVFRQLPIDKLYFSCDNWEFIKYLQKTFICQLRNIWFKCEFDEKYKDFHYIAQASGKKYFIECLDENEFSEIKAKFVLFTLKE